MVTLDRGRRGVSLRRAAWARCRVALPTTGKA
jgi:hypothetical protein